MQNDSNEEASGPLQETKGPKEHAGSPRFNPQQLQLKGLGTGNVKDSRKPLSIRIDNTDLDGSISLIRSKTASCVQERLSPKRHVFQLSPHGWTIMPEGPVQ